MAKIKIPTLDAKERHIVTYVLGVLIPMMGSFFYVCYRLGWMESPLKVLGAWFVYWYGYKTLRYLTLTYGKPPRDPLSYGKWAVITGGSSENTAATLPATTTALVLLLILCYS